MGREVRELGSVILSNDTQKEKAPYPMEVREFGSVILFKEEQFEKAHCPMEVTELGMTIEVNSPIQGVSSHSHPG